MTRRKPKRSKVKAVRVPQVTLKHIEYAEKFHKYAGYYQAEYLLLLAEDAKRLLKAARAK